jgi:predicted  nucleic acid-binding Zn-ribbon protein
MKEATAAMAQVEVTRKIIADEEAEITAIGRRIADLKQTAERQAEGLAAMDEEQAETRKKLSEERDSLQKELAQARAQREATSSRVSRPLLGKYDRIRGRRVNAVYSLREQSCGHCDTAIPLQRRNVMLSGAIEVCEACGVLLYSEEGISSRS